MSRIVFLVSGLRLGLQAFWVVAVHANTDGLTSIHDCETTGIELDQPYLSDPDQYCVHLDHQSWCASSLTPYLMRHSNMSADQVVDHTLHMATSL